VGEGFLGGFWGIFGNFLFFSQSDNDASFVLVAVGEILLFFV
jgi:hypothetical protein